MDNIFEQAKQNHINKNIPSGYDVSNRQTARIWPKFIKYFIINNEEKYIEDFESLEEFIIKFSDLKYRKQISYIYCENSSSIYEYHLKKFELHNTKSYAYRHHSKIDKSELHIYYLDGNLHCKDNPNNTNTLPIWSLDKRVIRQERKEKLKLIKN